MTEAQVHALPVSFDVQTAGAAFGFGRSKTYEMARDGTFPCPVLRFGNEYRVTKRDLLRVLGLEAEDGTEAKAG